MIAERMILIRILLTEQKMLLDAIEKATGKTISGRDSEDTIKAFGDSLK